jgi:hypothetical protein
MVRSVVPDFFATVYAFGFTYAPITQTLCAFLDVLRVGLVAQSPHQHNTRDRRPRTPASRRKS